MSLSFLHRERSKGFRALDDEEDVFENELQDRERSKTDVKVLGNLAKTDNNLEFTKLSVLNSSAHTEDILSFNENTQNKVSHKQSINISTAPSSSNASPPSSNTPTNGNTSLFSTSEANASSGAFNFPNETISASSATSVFDSSASSSSFFSFAKLINSSSPQFCSTSKPHADSTQTQSLAVSVTNECPQTRENIQLSKNNDDLKPVTYGCYSGYDLDNFDIISRVSSSPPPEEEGSSDMTCLLYLIVVFAAVTGLLMGYDLCIVAVVLDPVKQEFNVCNGRFVCTAKQLFVSMVAPGAVCGSLFGGIISDSFGRRLTLALSDVFFVVGSVLMGFGAAYYVLLIGRVCVGIGIGIGFVVFSTYIAELSPRDKRGQLVACQEVAQCAGCLLSYTIALIAGNEAWRWLLGAAGFIAFIQVLGIAILPESPRWYVRQNMLSKAVEVLKKLSYSNDEKIQKIAFQIQSDYEQELRLRAADQSQNSFSKRINELLNHKFQLCIAVGCAFCQNMTAANSILYYSNDIFKLAGVTEVFLPGVGLGFMKLLGVICCMLLVESCGRKKLLLLGSVGTCLCHILFIVAFLLQDTQDGDMLLADPPLIVNGGPAVSTDPHPSNSVAVKLSVVTMLTYMFFWNVSWAGLMFVVASEILPSSIRGIGMGLTITTFWLLAFFVQSTLESSFYYLTKPGTFGLYAFFNFLVILFAWFIIPETSGQSLEEISTKYHKDAGRGVGAFGGFIETDLRSPSGGQKSVDSAINIGRIEEETQEKNENHANVFMINHKSKKFGVEKNA